MGLVRNRLTRRFRTLGTLSDVAMVAAAGRRLAMRPRSAPRGAAEIGELLLAGGALLRLGRRLRNRRLTRSADPAA